MSPGDAMPLAQAPVQVKNFTGTGTFEQRIDILRREDSAPSLQFDKRIVPRMWHSTSIEGAQLVKSLYEAYPVRSERVRRERGFSAICGGIDTRWAAVDR